MDSLEWQESIRANLFAWISEGVRDTPVQYEIKSKTPEGRTGIKSFIGPFGSIDLRDALRHACTVLTDVNRTLDIDPRFVLSQPWNMDKFVDCMERLASGQEGYPIVVSGLQVQGWPCLYGVHDGMHRATAARVAGRRTIKAEVTIIRGIDLASIKLNWRNRVMRPPTLDHRFPDVRLRRTEAQILRSLGVEEFGTTLLRGWTVRAR